MVVSRWREGQVGGRGETSPKPVFGAMPTQPDHTSAAAGAARTSSGQDRTVLPGRDVTAARSAAAAGPAVRAGDGSLSSGSLMVPAWFTPTGSAAMKITTLPGWRGDGARRS